jgi:hypothetical protein
VEAGVRDLSARELVDLIELSLITDLPLSPDAAFTFDLATAVPSKRGNHHDHPACPADDDQADEHLGG